MRRRGCQSRASSSTRRANPGSPCRGGCWCGWLRETVASMWRSGDPNRAHSPSRIAGSPRFLASGDPRPSPVGSRGATPVSDSPSACASPASGGVQGLVAPVLPVCGASRASRFMPPCGPARGEGDPAQPSYRTRAHLGPGGHREAWPGRSRWCVWGRWQRRRMIVARVSSWSGSVVTRPQSSWPGTSLGRPPSPR